MPVVYDLKRLAAVPTAAELVDIVLLRTQRKTPTVVHPGYKITRIRSFYMRKVKFTQQTVSERLGAIVGDFPRLDDARRPSERSFSPSPRRRRVRVVSATAAPSRRVRHGGAVASASATAAPSRPRPPPRRRRPVSSP